MRESLAKLNDSVLGILDEKQLARNIVNYISEIFKIELINIYINEHNSRLWDNKQKSNARAFIWGHRAIG